MNEKQLRFALAIISGRITPIALKDEWIELLDLDPNDCTDSDILESAENIVFWAIAKALAVQS